MPQGASLPWVTQHPLGSRELFSVRLPLLLGAQQAWGSPRALRLSSQGWGRYSCLDKPQVISRELKHLLGRTFKKTSPVSRFCFPKHCSSI